VKLTIIAQVYNEMQNGNLVRFIDACNQFADSIIIYDDGSTDNTQDFLHHCQQMGTELYNIRSDENNFKDEIAHKQMLLNTAIEIKSDWILWLDADEVPDAEGQAGGIRKLIEDKETDGFTFHQINLWRSDKFYRVDNQYNDGIFLRLWKNNGRLKYDSRPGLHQRQYPLGLDRVKDSPLQIIHYGFASDTSIIRKYYTYKAHGQEGWALDRLINEDTLAVRHINPAWLRWAPTGPGTEIFLGE
jgi:glycosyltransferase involved in cell wall biosynthesis